MSEMQAAVLPASAPFNGQRLHRHRVLLPGTDPRSADGSREHSARGVPHEALRGLQLGDRPLRRPEAGLQEAGAYLRT